MTEATALEARPDAAGDGTIAARLDAMQTELRKVHELLARLIDKTTINEESILSFAELAQHLGITDRTVRRHIAKGMPTLCDTKRYGKVRYGEALAWITRHVKRRRRRST